MTIDKSHVYKPPFRVEVIADNTGTWAGNALTFPTPEEAEADARSLFARWTAVRKWRVVDAEGTPHTAGGQE